MVAELESLLAEEAYKLQLLIWSEEVHLTSRSDSWSATALSFARLGAGIL